MFGRLGLGFGWHIKSAQGAFGTAPLGAKVAIIGDSIGQGAHYANEGGTILANRLGGELTIAQALFPAFHAEVFSNPDDTRGTRYFTGANFSVSGDTVAQAKTRLITNGEVWPSEPDILVIMVGTNSILGGDDEAITADLQDMAEAAIAEGIRVVLATVPPRATNSGVECTTGVLTTLMDNPTDQATWVAVNAWIEAYAEATANVWLWDRTSGVLEDAETGNVLDWMTSDGLHFSSLGAWHTGKALAETLALIIAPGLWFDDDPDADNLMPGGDFAGTSGAGDGDIADGWSLERWEEGAGIDVTGTKEADGSNSKQVLTFEVQGDGSTAGVYGDDMILNGTFDDGDDITADDGTTPLPTLGYSVSGGQLVKDATGGFPILRFGITTPFVAGRTYRITYDVIGSEISAFFALANMGPSNGNVTLDGAVGTGKTVTFEFGGSTTSVLRLCINGAGVLDNMIVQELLTDQYESEQWLLSRGGYPGSFTLPEGIDVGDWLQCKVKVEISAWASWQQIQLDTRILDSGDSVLFNAIGGLQDNTTPSQVFPEATTVWLTTEPFQVPEGAAKFVFFLWLSALAYDQTGSGVLKFSNAILRIVDDPTEVWPSGPIS